MRRLCDRPYMVQFVVKQIQRKNKRNDIQNDLIEIQLVLFTTYSKAVKPQLNLRRIQNDIKDTKVRANVITRYTSIKLIIKCQSAMYCSDVRSNKTNNVTNDLRHSFPNALRGRLTELGWPS